MSMDRISRLRAVLVSGTPVLLDLGGKAATKLGFDAAPASFARDKESS
jgi:hypothetical protein